MGKIILFEERNLMGRSVECMSDCPELTSNLSRCMSCRVESGCFMIYERSNFMGNQHLLTRGEVSDITSLIGMSSGVKSCRLIPMHRGQFRMRIYERENLSGQMNELMDDVENIQEQLRMSDCQSCQVLEGHWLLFEQPHFRGRMIYVKPGEHRSIREMGMNSMKIMSMRRITDMCM
ncbi:gamma-crystallin M3-like [Synchiropus splendidus]|uniref:gamma-crystallin M3-like n=1 Tax=Synchiropus splendidus TaxID=270530 RepID=UPI00237ED1C1|nr:gamma-crystallin M3-like [Synchiropus splendidus]